VVKRLMQAFSLLGCIKIQL